MTIKNIGLVCIILLMPCNNLVYGLEDTLRDPMAVGKFKKENFFDVNEGVKLQAIIVSDDGNKKCIIKDILLSVGDVINNYKVQDIYEDRVLLIDANEDQKVITLY